LTTAVLFEATFGQWIRLGPTTPDLLLIVLVWFSLDLRLSSALALGMAAALIKIAASGEPPLLILITLAGSATFSNWAARQFIKEAVSVQLGILALLCFTVYLMTLIWIQPFNSAAAGIRFFFSHVVLTTLYTIAVAPWIWRWMKQLFIRCGWESSTRSIS
jgi:hypothetical protein